MEHNTPLVSILTLTYNQANYIRQCLDGIVMQKTSFPIEILVHDDASTDGTAQIVKEYESRFPDIVKPIYQKENQYSKGISLGKKFLYPKARGKYIAFCEGDDYWIDCYKLQKQVDFLESHPEYGMVYSRALFYDQERNDFSNELFGTPFSSHEEMIAYNHIPTLTVCARKELIERYNQEVEPEKQGWKMGDYPMWLWIMFHSQVGFLPETTAVYRVLKHSESHTEEPRKREAFILSDLGIKDFFVSRYDVELTETYHQQRNLLLYMLYRLFLKKHDYAKAKKYHHLIQKEHLPERYRRRLFCFPVRYFFYSLKKKK